MARDWEAAQTLEMVEQRMRRYGDNAAPVPLAMTKESREGVEVWCVDLHIKIIRVTEFDISTEGATLGEALRRAYLGLNNETNLLRWAEKSNEIYGVEP